ncbi:T9SS type A sorting domain-containing protein [Fluviicola sp.]|uniref:T9SS type A sorting domain-containing protein n=1 Tax=Fluviicola sp. TaxID=1917219 RepID=UPI0031DAEB24
MKKILFFAFSMLCCSFLDAQTINYQPLHGDYTQYVYQHQHWDGSQNVENFHKTIWSGDTLIGGQHYVRIFQFGVYAGGVREDIPNQRRFFIDLNNQEKEITISPFLTTGALLTDSSVFLNAFRSYIPFIDDYCNTCDTLQVTAVDSILEANGTYSATYHLEVLPQPNISFDYNTYEGLINVNGFEAGEHQICYREDGEQTPPGQETPWTIMCDLGINEAHLLQIELFPNPVSESFNLSGDLGLITDLAIYNISGIFIKQIPLSGINAAISISDLKSGIYLLSANGNQKVLRFQKM